ncbi:SGT2 (YOR007C) [Zygosaccharomyces parabailii]|uniref:ZYBA0S04-03664g1_1 n=1 Tax=Zygosaccharomyces bailii (strain CLIB 213 / ATCC 58445 / CBS 680 / BCRC 21525 / NBRC 1098 / NCYC 1416 / NRRL Y-2227) TaxID=1333698 RepID=A0A8J2X7W4_ZYGB2|nr:SGT2 (YOR007C) [Zygosaccharomyces parabailii]CDF89412.1 ZYBA0S04-03664g1_1 [Zygosaccharomyces bailii CLIB 213]CDH13536.1 related to SGT2-Glutamine-rich cytoplasmic protein [Zygosaccharomyces bailii ISA1307]
MAPSNKDISSLIVDYLSDVISNKSVAEDSIDSLNVAIECISEAFGVEKGSSSAAFGGKTLIQLLSGNESSSSGQEEGVKVNIPAEDAEVKAKAEHLKLEGNKAMAGKNYELAIEKYSAAISVLPTNAVYFANRAAAYSSLKDYDEAVKDAESAIQVDPSYSKGYSRLGYAKFAQGKSEEALEAYKKALDIEGDSATDIMKRDYETAKKKVEQSLELNTTESSSRDAKASDEANTNPGGFDFASMLGGGLGGGLGGLLNNPQVMQAAQQMMQNPQAMRQMEAMMQNPSVRQMAEKFTGGNGSPNLSEMMNNPALREMAGNLFGGAGAGASPDGAQKE